MNMMIKNLALASGIALLAGHSFGQKSIETSAAVEFKNRYQSALMSGDIEAAKKSLLAAKGYIDQASAHEETMNSQKTLWLKGEIYANFIILSMQAQDTAFMKLGGEDPLNTSIEAFSKGYPINKKMQPDFETSVEQKALLMNGMANMMYQTDHFGEAAEVYDYIVRYYGAVNVLDSTSLFNSALCYEKSEQYPKAAAGFEKLGDAGYKGVASYVDASRNYRKAGDLSKAKSMIEKGRAKNPSDRDLLLELVNTNLEEGNAEGAEKALSDAIAADPKNKQLYYTIGTIYIDLGQNEKAEESLNKALEIDPDYADAQYQLGAHLVTWAGSLKEEANGLKFGDPRYNTLLQQSEETYKRALIPLEKYILSAPDDKAVLTILFQLHRSLGNSEKALEYKKRSEGL